MIFTNEIDDLKNRLDQLKPNEKMGIHERIDKYTEICKTDDYQSYKKARDKNDYFLARDILERQSNSDREYFKRCYKYDKYIEEIELVLKKESTDKHK